MISHQSGKRAPYGSLAKAAAVATPREVTVALKAQSESAILGTPRNRIDGLDAVTGRKKLAMDLDVPDAKPTMVCLPPTINGTVRSVKNTDIVKNMPGITDVSVITHGVAVRGETFGQCIDARLPFHAVHT